MGNDKLVYWLDEVCREHNDVVGKKCANLGELRKGGFPVPYGFVLSLKAYNEFMQETGTYEENCRWLSTFRADAKDPKEMPKFEEASKVICNIIESKRMPDHLENIIKQYYDELCQKIDIDNVPVAVRSAGAASHPGQFESYLYVKGKLEVMAYIMKVWSSTFNTRSLINRARQNISLETSPIGVAVIQMIDAKAAGVTFTIEPSKPDFTRMTMEGNWGLGESVVSGRVTPDRWLVDRTTLKVVYSEIGQKAFEYILDPKTGKTTYVEVPPERQKVPCATEDEIHELAKLSKNIERHFNQPQDIEWAIKKESPLPGSIMILQTRPQKIVHRIGIL